MNYPMESLAIVAPIFFIFFVILFPVIGLFAGWKRGLFWGVGNLLFYVIGLLVYNFAGITVAGKITPLFEGFLKGFGLEGDLKPLTTALLAPVFFLVVFLVGNLLLLINYYAWYKRVVGLKKPKKPRLDDQGNPKPKKSQFINDAKKQKIVNPNQVQVKTGKQKAINMIFGALSLGGLMLPITFTFTKTIYFGTTSPLTRSKNKLSANLFNGLVKLEDKMGWMSYYTKYNSTEDYQALWSTINVVSKKVEVINPFTGEDEGTMDIKSAFTSMFKDGLGELFKEINTIDEETPAIQKATTIMAHVNNLIASWNNLYEQAGIDLTGMLGSRHVTLLLSDILKGTFGQSVSSDVLDIYSHDQQPGQFRFDMVLALYEMLPEDKKAKPLILKDENYHNLTDPIIDGFTFDEGTTDDQKQCVIDAVKQIISLLITSETSSN